MSSESATFHLPATLSVRTLLQASPPELDMVLPGLLRGTVGSLVSPGGLGKSYWALGLGLSLQMLRPEYDLTGLKPAPGRVLLLCAEDPEIILTQRLQAYKTQLPAKVSLDGLDIRSLVGYVDPVTRQGLDVMHDDVYAALAAAGKNYRLIVLDTLSRFHALDENSAPDMKRLLAQLERLAQDTGAAILFLHHTSKASVLAGQGTLQQAARGSSVLTDNTRWVGFLAPMTEAEARKYGKDVSERANYVRFNMSKQNYGCAIPDQWYRREAGGVLCPVLLTESKTYSAQPRLEVDPVRDPGTAPATGASEQLVAAPERVGIPTANNVNGGKW